MTDLELIEYNAWSNIIERWLPELENYDDKQAFIRYLIERLTQLLD